MPPIYVWVCDQCKRQAEVIRSFEESEVPPDDVPAQGPTESGEPCSHESWTKQVAKTQPHQRAPGFGRKGHW